MTTAFDAPIDPYAALPGLYDLEHADFNDDVALYLQLADVVGDPILELGSGTGRVLEPLVRAGWRVTGIDRSRPMLDRAREKLADAIGSGKAALHEGSMTEADQAPGGPFGLVLISLNGIMHLPTLTEQRQALAAAKRSLDPRGMLVIDAHNPSPEFLAHFDGRVHHEGTWQREDGVITSRFAARTLSPSRQRIETELWYDIQGRDGEVKRVQTGFPMRYLMAAELELLLELVGFVEWRLYGSYDLEPYSDESDRLIVTAEVTPS